MSRADNKSLDRFGDAWHGCRIERDRLILNNGETYTVQELEALRCHLNNWRRIAQATQRDLAKSGMQGAVVFPLSELNQIRAALRLLDAKLPGRSMQHELEASRRRHA